MNAIGVPLILLGELLLVAAGVIWLVQRLSLTASTPTDVFPPSSTDIPRSPSYNPYPQSTQSAPNNAPVFPNYTPPLPNQPMTPPPETSFAVGAPQIRQPMLDERTAKLARLDDLLAKRLITQQEYDALRQSI